MLLQNILGCIPSKKDEMAHANKDRAWPSQHGMSRACAFARTRWASLHLHGRVKTCAVIMVDSYSGSTRPSSSMLQLQCTFKAWQHIADAVAAAAVVTTASAAAAAAAAADSILPCSSLWQFQYTFKTWQHIVDAVAAAAAVTTTPAGGCQVNGV